MKEHWMHFRAHPSMSRPGGLIVAISGESGETVFYPSAAQVRDLIATLQLGLDRLDEEKAKELEDAA